MRRSSLECPKWSSGHFCLRADKSPRPPPAAAGELAPGERRRSERPGQEDAVRVGAVVRERPAVLEAELLVQPPGRQEEIRRPRLQAQPGETHPPGPRDEGL